MSDLLAEARDSGGPRGRESTAGALGVLVGLALIVGTAWVVVRPGAEIVDAAAVLAVDFDLGALPPELSPRRAAALPGGELLIALSAHLIHGLQRESAVGCEGSACRATVILPLAKGARPPSPHGVAELGAESFEVRIRTRGELVVVGDPGACTTSARCRVRPPARPCARIR